MRRPLAPAITALVAAVALAPAAAEEVDHPAYTSWAKHPIGTSITMRSSTASANSTLTTTTTTKLVALKPDVATLESVKVSDATGTTVVGRPEIYEQRRPFPLFGGVKKEDIGKPSGAGAKGEETLTLAGREFKAVWYDARSKGDGGLDLTTRTWLSDEVPGRLLKSVTQIPKAGTTITVELTEFRTP